MEPCGREADVLKESSTFRSLCPKAGHDLLVDAQERSGVHAPARARVWDRSPGATHWGGGERPASMRWLSTMERRKKRPRSPCSWISGIYSLDQLWIVTISIR